MRSDRIAVRQRQLGLELFADVVRKDLVLLQAFDDFIIERGKFADFLLQHFLHVIFPEVAQITQTDKTVSVPARQALLDEFEERRSNQFGRHSVVRRLRFLADLADKFGRLFHRSSFSK